MHQFNHPAGDAPVVEVRHPCKTFVLHQQGGIRIQALQCRRMCGPARAFRGREVDPAQDPVR